MPGPRRGRPAGEPVRERLGDVAAVLDLLGPAGGDRPARRLERGREPDRRPAARRDEPAEDAGLERLQDGGGAQRPRLRRRGRRASSRQLLLERRTGRRAPGSSRAGELPPAFTARRTAARRTASARAASTPSPVRPQVAWAGSVEQLPEPPGVHGDPAPRGLVGQVGGEDHRQARGPGRRARAAGGAPGCPASTTTRIASGAACEEAGPERVVAGGLVVQGAGAGQVHQPGLAAAGRDQCAARGRRSCRARWRSRRSGGWRGRGTWTCRRWGGRPGRRRAGGRPRRSDRHPGTRGGRPASGIRPGSSGCRRGGGSRPGRRRAAESARRARPSSTTTGPPSGVRAVTTTTLPGRTPSRSSSARSGPSTPRSPRRQPTATRESGTGPASSRDGNDGRRRGGEAGRRVMDASKRHQARLDDRDQGPLYRDPGPGRHRRGRRASAARIWV